LPIVGPAPDPDNGRDAIPDHENRDMTIACAICRRPFIPRRSTAQFCGPTCRQTAHRRARQSPIGKSRNAGRCSEGNIRSARGPSDSAGRAGRPLSPKAPGSASRRLDALSTALQIVPDQLWPDMWRLVFSNGRISGLLNITRAKDAVARAQRYSRRSKTPPNGSPIDFRFP
jgi:hypothetical protein